MSIYYQTYNKRNHLNCETVIRKQLQSESAIYNPNLLRISEYLLSKTTMLSDNCMVTEFSLNEFQFYIKLRTKNGLNVETNSHMQATMI
jgi:hypothetical protein